MTPNDASVVVGGADLAGAGEGLDGFDGEVESVGLELGVEVNEAGDEWLRPQDEGSNLLAGENAHGVSGPSGEFGAGATIGWAVGGVKAVGR